MARIEDVAPIGDGRFINAEERAMLAGCPLVISEVRDEDGHRYQGKPAPRWLVGVATTTGEKVLLGLSKNGTRDYAMSAVLDALDNGETIDPVIFEMVTPDDETRSPYWAFRSATDQEVDAGLAPEWDEPAPAPVAVGAEKLAKARR